MQKSDLVLEENGGPIKSCDTLPESEEADRDTRHSFGIRGEATARRRGQQWGMERAGNLQQHIIT